MLLGGPPTTLAGGLLLALLTRRSLSWGERAVTVEERVTQPTGVCAVRHCGSRSWPTQAFRDAALAAVLPPTSQETPRQNRQPNGSCPQTLRETVNVCQHKPLHVGGTCGAETTHNYPHNCWLSGEPGWMHSCTSGRSFTFSEERKLKTWISNSVLCL